MRTWPRRAVLAAAAAFGPAWGMARASAPAAEDARALIDLIFENYAYRERLEGFPETRLRALRDSADQVASARDLIGFGERALAALFDHHAILGSSRSDSYGLVPSYADLWIETRGGRYVVTDVRHASPAEAGGVRPGDHLAAVDGLAMTRAIARFIEAPAHALSAPQREVCARVLAAGRRDRPRTFTFTRGGRRRRLELANLYAATIPREGVLSAPALEGGVGLIRLNDSLGDDETIAAFAASMTRFADARALILDLRDTPSGGNSSVARGILAWFVDRPMPYQRHELTAESLSTGVRRSWIEEVSPHGARTCRGRVLVLVGRWTGSMGEGLAIGFDAIGATVIGSPMAGLRGAVYDLALPNTGLVLKLPVERLAHVDGRPREAYIPPVAVAHADARDAEGRDLALEAALVQAAV